MNVICEECGYKNYYTKNRPTMCRYCGNLGNNLTSSIPDGHPDKYGFKDDDLISSSDGT